MKKYITLSEINRLNYGKAPEWWQIEELVNEMQLSYAQFERFYGIPGNKLTQIKRGERKLPAYAWHFVYEKIKPAYGAKFVSDYNQEAIDKFAKEVILPKKKTKKSNKINTKVDFHDRLSKVS